jgi:S-adenosylmethionine:tRNA ribosyltransferase-isomerase
MRLEDFDFTLPEGRIALRPARPRDAAKLLVIDPQAERFADHVVADLGVHLRPGDLLVFNDTRVIPAALEGVRPARAGGGADVPVSVNLHKRIGSEAWRAFARPGKRLKPGDTLRFGEGLAARIVEKSEGDLLLAFTCAGAALDCAIAAAGRAPLPPYIAERRAPDAADLEDYQTVFARKDGSVAAPTAGLHFTERLLADLQGRGVSSVFVTLHVGAGTFLPVKTADVAAHRLHGEWREIAPEAAGAVNAAKAQGRRVVAVGTTALRTLESAGDAQGRLRAVAGETDLFILPGFRFQIADGLWTNFHLPRSTLFMLVSAFGGTARMQAAYQHAIANGYRFYSYGDASLIWRADG